MTIEGESERAAQKKIRKREKNINEKREIITMHDCVSI